MARFGNDYWVDYDSVMTMDREGLIQSLLSISEDNKVLKFSKEFLERYHTSKLRHIMWDAVRETFYTHWEREEKDEPKSLCSESSGN